MNKSILVLVSLLVMTGIGYAGYYYSSTHQPLSQNTVADTSPVNSRNTQDSGNTHTYTSRHGFSLNYPKDWFPI